MALRLVDAASLAKWSRQTAGHRCWSRTRLVAVEQPALAESQHPEPWPCSNWDYVARQNPVPLAWNGGSEVWDDRGLVATRVFG